MTPITPKTAFTVVLVLAAGALLHACCRPCCPPPIPLRDQVVMRGNVDRVAEVVPAVATSPFLASYRGARALKPNPDRTDSFVWVKPGLDLRVYDHLLFDEVQIVPAPGSQVGSLDPDLKRRAIEALGEIMRETVSPYYDVVEEPGEHVLRVRLVVTDLVPAQERVAGEPTASVGGAALEGELVDGRTGEKLLAFADRIEGSARGEVAEAEWRPAEGAFREWADALLDFLDHWEERVVRMQ